MSQIHKIGSILILLLCINSCSKNTEKFDPYGDTGQVENLLNKIDNNTESYVILGQEDQAIVSNSNLIIKIDAGTIVDREDNVVSGEVKLLVKNIISAGHSVLTGSSTKVNTDIFSANTLLDIRITDKEDNPLFIKQGEQIELLHPVESTIMSENLRLFQSKSLAGSSVSWEEVSNPESSNMLNQDEWEFQIGTGSIFGSGYTYTIDEFGWYSIGDYLNTDGTGNTKLCLDLPELFNKNNTKVFFVLKDFISVVNLQALEDTNSTFCGLIVQPQTTESSCIITLSSTEDGDYYLGYVKNPDISESIIAVVPEKTTLDKISQFLYER